MTNPEILALQLPAAPIAQIADIIRRDWAKPYFGAVPYLAAMMTLPNIDSNYGADSGRDIVLYFLSNAGGWRGPVARLVKAELNRRLKG